MSLKKITDLFWTSEEGCEKYFKTESKKLNIKAITGKIGDEATSKFNLGIGEFSIDPKNVKGTEKLLELDMQQWKICLAIRNLENGEEKEKLKRKYVEILIEMLSVTQMQQKTIEEEEIVKDKVNKEEKIEMQIENDLIQIKEMLSNNKKIRQALNTLRQKYPNENSIIMFLADYNQLTDNIEMDLEDYSSIEWKKLRNRILLFVDRKIEND